MPTRTRFTDLHMNGSRKLAGLSGMMLAGWMSGCIQRDAAVAGGVPGGTVHADAATDSGASRKSICASPLVFADDVERIIDENPKRASRRWRQSQAARLSDCPDDQTVEYAHARTLVEARSAEGRGLEGLAALRRAAKYAEIAFTRDPEFREGATRRTLGSILALASEHLAHGDSERGIELLSEQLEKYPEDPRNYLRAIEGYVALDDLKSAIDIYCSYSNREFVDVILRKEDKALRSELSKIMQSEGVACTK